MVPKRLKEAREAAGLSQEKLSELIGVEGVNTRSRLSNYEVGRFTPPFDFILRVAKALDYPESYFSMMMVLIVVRDEPLFIMARLQD